MEFVETALPGVILVKPDVFGDKRGYFVETYHQKKYIEKGLKAEFVQDNESSSSKGVLRGLHYQRNKPQGKLLRVVIGEVMDVAVDIRKGSLNFGQWTSAVLSSDNKHQLYIPPGFAHGFYTMSDLAIVHYKCTEFYNAESDSGILWNDPEIGVEWPTDTPVLSDRDTKHPLMKDAILTEY